MSDYIIEMRDVVKRFGSLTANNHITLKIKKGEILALLGENGAGKSTLMSILSGMYEPDEGEILVYGKKEHINSPSYAAKLNIGMVHQHFKLVSDFTITENIIMGMEPEKKLLGLFPYVDIKSANKKVSELSEKYGLKVNPTQLIKDADISVRQRVEILKMLYREAQILIFDEPTAVLAPEEIQFLLEIIKGLREQGKTIILITHKLEEIKKVADRCAILCQGNLTGIVNTDSTTTSHMANLMVGREVSFGTPKKEAEFKNVVLSVEGISVCNQGSQAVKNVTFKVHGGEIFAIAGVSGNGQAEIADAVAGLLSCRSGCVRLNGIDITHKSIRERILAGISYVPEDRQNTGLVLDFNLEENTALKMYSQKPFSNKGILKYAEFSAYAERLIDAYDIRSSEGKKTVVRTMSGGNQQKAIIAREIEMESSLMIFVQPTRGLDIGAIERIHKQIIGERDKGKAVLLISLELEEIMDCADTVAVIYNGEIQKIAPISEITIKEAGRFMMGVKGEEGA